MDSNRAVDDLKVIRNIMERTRRNMGGHSGWFMVLWGAIWFVGFLGNQFLSAREAGFLWMGLTCLGALGSGFIGVRLNRRRRVSSPIWRPLVFSFVALFAYVGLLAWLFDLHTPRDISLLIVLTISLSYVQLGLFTHRAIALIGALLAVLVVGASLLLPGYFFLLMAFLSGGLLVGSGLWFVRREE
jgi:hypothetical protein